MDLGQTHLDLAVTALTAPTPQDAWPSLVELCLQHGADTHIIMHVNLPYSQISDYGRLEHTLIHRYPRQFLERLASDLEYARHDPIARRVRRSKRSFFFDTTYHEKNAPNKQETQFARDLRDSGLRCGSVIPLHNREECSISGLCQGVGFGGDGDAELVKRSMDKMRILATYFNEELRLRGRLDDRYLAIFETAARYQMYHALGLLLLATLGGKLRSKLFRLIPYLWFVGVMLFSGPIYLNVFAGISSISLLTPVGGVLIIIGWALLIVAAISWASGQPRKHKK